MRHSERRSVLLAQHEQLRMLIAAVSRASADVLASSEEALPDRAAALVRAIATFADDLRAHLAAEERLLGPVLERLDSWGPLRLELLRTEHAHQRAVLDALRADRNLSTRELARRARSLAADVLLDMDAEERDLLAESVLRDDPIVLDQSDS
jgi:hypothetical protein